MDAVAHRRFASGDIEKTASIKRLGARLTARAASDTLVILEKGCLKFLYPDTPEFLRPHRQPHADAHLRRANYRDVLVARLAIFHRTSPCDADFAIARYVSYRELFRASPEP